MQKMKRQIHQCLLGLTLCIIIPGALLAMLLAVASVGSGFQSGFGVSNFLVLPLLLIPAHLGWWGCKLFFRLYSEFLPRVRTLLFRFYSAVSVYCGLWLISTFSHGGIKGSIFSLQEQVLGLILLLIPLVAVGFTKPDLQPMAATNNNE